jgi:hypothetical protein
LDGYLYFAARSNKLAIFKVNPENGNIVKAIRSGLTVDYRTGRIKVEGDYLYVRALYSYNDDVYLIKLDKDLNPIYCKKFDNVEGGGMGYVPADGKVYFVAKYQSTSYITLGIYYENNNSFYLKHYEGIFPYLSTGSYYSLVLCDDGLYFLGYRSNVVSSTSDKDILLAKADLDLNIKFVYAIGGEKNEYPSELLTDSCKDFYVVGIEASLAFSDFDFFIIKSKGYFLENMTTPLFKIKDITSQYTQTSRSFNVYDCNPNFQQISVSAYDKTSYLDVGSISTYYYDKVIPTQNFLELVYSNYNPSTQVYRVYGSNYQTSSGAGFVSLILSNGSSYLTAFRIYKNATYTVTIG